MLCFGSGGGVAGARGSCGPGGVAAIGGGYALETRGAGETAGANRGEPTPAALEPGLDARAQFRHSPDDGSGAPHLMHLDT